MSDQALRYNESKPELVFMLDFPNAMKGLCEVKSFGAKKYELHNWKKGRSFRDTISSLLRHLMALQERCIDPDSGLPDIDHVVWNSLALAEWYRTHSELNDYGPNLPTKEKYEYGIPWKDPKKLSEKEVVSGYLERVL